MICAGCEERLLDDNHLKCNACNSKYCLACLSIEQKNVTGMDCKQLAKLKCPSCVNVTKRKNDDCSPVRQTYAAGMVKPIGKTQPPPQGINDTILEEIRRLRSDMNKQFETQKASLERTNSILAIMQTEVADLSTKISSIRSELDGAIDSVQFLSEWHDDQVKLNKETEGTIHQLVKNNNLLSAQVADMNIKLGLMEQQYRECNIEIQSVPEFKNENLLNLIQQLLKTVTCNVPDSEILSFHRVAKQNSKSDRPRNIVVKFSSTRTRDTVLAATKTFNDQNKHNKLNASHLGIASSKKPVYVTEHLSPANKLLHAATRSLAKEKNYEFVWVKNGRIFIRKDQKDSAKLVKNMDFLKTL